MKSATKLRSANARGIGVLCLVVALVSPAASQIRSAPQLTAEFTGAGVSLSPQKSLALVGGKGQTTNRSVLIVNREADPLRIVTVEHPTDRFTTRLETIEDGRRYRVTLTLRPDGPLGRGQQTLRIKTSSSATPVLAIPIGVRLTP